MSGPPPPGITCAVYVDGNRLADTGADYRAAAPTVLDGLRVVWGRGSVVDQPDAGTCTFTVADPDAGGEFLGLLHTGHRVDVWAAAPTSAATPSDVALDGGFEQAAVAQRVQVSGGTVAADTAQPYAGSKALRVTPGAGAGTVAIPPGPFSTAATAWNPIPQAAAG